MLLTHEYIVLGQGQLQHERFYPLGHDLSVRCAAPSCIDEGPLLLWYQVPSL